MPSIEWNGNCNICRNPLDAFIHCDNLDDIKVFNDLVDTTCLYKNYSKYKFFGLKAKKICVSCYLNIKNNRYKFNRIKETTGKYIIHERSMSQEELKEWFMDCKKYYRCF